MTSWQSPSFIVANLICTRMGSDISSWRMSIGLFYGAMYGAITKRYIGKISFNTSFLFRILLYLRKCLFGLGVEMYKNIYNIETSIIVWLLLILSGDIETNPGPDNIYEHSVSILHSNIRSIRNKIDYIIDNFSDFECCFTETHLDDNVENLNICLTSEFGIPYRKDRTNHGGGILVYVKNNLIHKRRPELEIFCEESLWVEIKINKQPFLLGTFYSPKTQDRLFFDAFDKNIEKALELSQNIIIVGDLNEDLLNDNFRNLRDILLTNSLQNLISVPTRDGAILDPIIVPDNLTVFDSGVLSNPNEISDHSATYIVLPHDYSTSSTYIRRVWSYKRADFVKLEENIRLFDWSCLLNGTVNESCTLFMNKFMEFVNACIPHKDVVIRPNDKPWYDSEIRKFSRKRDRQKAKAVRTSSQNDWKKYKILRNKVNNLKKHAKETFHNNLELSLLTSFNDNKKDFWKIVKHFTSKKDSVSSIPPLCTTDASGNQTWHVSDGQKSDCLNSYFASVSSLDDTNAELPPFIEHTHEVLENINVTEEEIKDIILNLDPNKASGPDLISNKMIKPVVTVIVKPLCILFNRSLREAVFPDIWKLGNLVPLFKKGDRSKTSNYRPVSLLSNIGKIQERIVFKHMYNHFVNNNLLFKYQSGFRPGHSTTYQLVDIFHHICQSFDEKQYSCMVFCDISKAFDKVWHKGLLFKLRQNGIKGNLLLWISNYLTSRKQRVQINSATSSLLSVNAGVPQGSVLGPLLFLIYVNDIAENLLSLVRLFADDSSLFFSATNLRDIEGIINHDLYSSNTCIILGKEVAS